MEEEKTKVLKPEHQKERRIVFSRIKRKIFKHTFILRTLLILAFVLILIGIVFVFGNLFKGSSVSRYSKLTTNFIFSPDSQLKSYNGRTNILILGKGGFGHDAPDLTDTIILMSVSATNNSIVTISLPRDIWISELRAKLNSAYYWGEKKDVGMGIVLAKSTVEEIVGVPVHYAFVIDFASFEKIIDAVSGIDVNVINGFVDDKYPITGKENDDCGGDTTYMCRYERVEFKEGLTHMDGETALKYVRSRNSESDEGTDLARAARQELIISSLKNKILSKEVMLSPKKLILLRKIVNENLETDISSDSGAVLVRRVFDARKNISGHVLPEDLLENPPKLAKYDNLYVFVPKVGDWNGVKDWVQSVLK